MTNVTRIVGDPDRPKPRILYTEPGSLDGVTFQRRATPAPEDFTLIGQIAADRSRRLAATLAAPGFATRETLAVSTFNLLLPVCRALVGDEPVRVGTDADGTSGNAIAFDAPPVSGTRWDVAFLESWVAEIGPIGSADATSKLLPVAGGVGNFDQASNPAFALRAPLIAKETTRRTQVRWRLRVAAGVDLDTYPLGLGDPSILGRGDAGSPVASHPFDEVPDRTSVFRAGNGEASDATLFANATGYTYAIPIAAILRTSGESALTLTGSVDLRELVISRSGVATGMTLDVLPLGAYTVGAGASGEAATWRQPKVGGGFFPANLPGTSTDTPLSGAFVMPLNDFNLPPGWTLSGRLYGNVFRQESGSGTGAKTYGIRVRRPGQTFGQSVKEITFTLGPVNVSDGDYAALEDQHVAFDIPSDGSAAGIWVVELYSEVAAAGVWITSGVKLRVYAETN